MRFIIRFIILSFRSLLLSTIAFRFSLLFVYGSRGSIMLIWYPRDLPIKLQDVKMKPEKKGSQSLAKHIDSNIGLVLKCR
uniref:Putative secreted peptide n=1 Tax=Anopheles braziliensis TaxID=58242 RepID=A0A2M3ZNL6_9DIPT